MSNYYMVRESDVGKRAYSTLYVERLEADHLRLSNIVDAAHAQRNAVKKVNENTSTDDWGPLLKECHATAREFNRLLDKDLIDRKQLAAIGHLERLLRRTEVETEKPVQQEDSGRNDIELAEELFDFLQGTVPGGYVLVKDSIPKLTPSQAWTVIWYLGNLYWQVPDHICRCGVCGDLYDSDYEGDYLDGGEPPYFFCETCQYDPIDDERAAEPLCEECFQKPPWRREGE